MELIYQLTLTGIEYKLASFIEPVTGPEFARRIANFLVSILDISIRCRNKAIEDKLGAVDNSNRNTIIVGGGHGPNKIHKDAINKKINDMANSGEYDVIYGNRALSTAGFVGSQRPDIIAVKCDGDKIIVDVFEFASPSQASGSKYEQLTKKN